MIQVKETSARILAFLLALLLAVPAVEARHRSHGQPRTRQGKRHHYLGSRSTSSLVFRIGRRGRHRAIARLPQEIGVLVVNEAGDVVVNQLADVEFNPASAVKIITAYGALKTFGAEHKFSTSLHLDGHLDEASGAFQGDVYVQGGDPDFRRCDALNLGEALAQSGIKKVQGKVLVSADFSYCSDPNASRSAKRLVRIWRAMKESPVVVQGGVGVASAKDTTEPVAEIQSEPLRETLKEMLSLSLNHVAEQIGRSVGGIKRLEELVAQASGTDPAALKLASASGLGRSRVKPRDMMMVLQSLRATLQSNGLDLADIFPVAGIDRGTLDDRFTGPAERGSVVAKTGTLPGTDGGTSALVGMFRSQKEDLYFVIFCWRGSVVGFRHHQDEIIRKLQSERGGPKTFDYGAGSTPVAGGV